MNIVERVKGIILRPRQEWQTISGESITIGSVRSKGLSKIQQRENQYEKNDLHLIKHCLRFLYDDCGYV